MAENDNTFIDNADNVFFGDIEGEQGKALLLEEDQKLNLVGIIEGRFSDAETARISHEHRWLKAYRNYRGLYDKRVKFRESEKSKVFVKITKTKVLAAFGQLVDVVFGTGKFPIGVRETKIPEGISEYVHLDTQNPSPGIETSIPEVQEEVIDNPFDVGFEGDGKVLKPGATFSNGKFIEEEAAEILSEGPSPMPEAIEIKPAQRSARRMEKLIHDQIEESSGSSEIRNALLESALLGTGIVKGPFNFNKTLNRWDEGEEGERTYAPVDVRVPRIEFVSVWDFFPDPAATNIDECEYVFHRHKLNKSQLRALRKMPYFDSDAIRECLMMGANYEDKYYDTQLRDEENDEAYGSDKYEVLEYWGIMDAEYMREAGVDVPDSIDDLDEIDPDISRGVLDPASEARRVPKEGNTARNIADTTAIKNGPSKGDPAPVITEAMRKKGLMVGPTSRGAVMGVAEETRDLGRFDAIVDGFRFSSKQMNAAAWDIYTSIVDAGASLDDVKALFLENRDVKNLLMGRFKVEVINEEQARAAAFAMRDLVDR